MEDTFTLFSKNYLRQLKAEANAQNIKQGLAETSIKKINKTTFEASQLIKKITPL